MKNKIKLINLLPAAALSTVPVVVTSCAKTNWVEPLEMVELIDGYEPQIEPPETSEWQNQNDVTNFYIDEVKSDPTIFQEDMINSMSCRKEVIQNIADPMVMKSFKVGVSQPTFGTTRIWQTQSKDEIYNTISFKEKIELEFDTFDTSNSYVKNIIQSITLNVEYKDVIYMAFEPTFETQQPNTIWSLGFIDQTYGAESLWVHKNNTQPWSINFSVVNQKKKYMSDVSGKPDVVITDTSYYSGNVNSAYRMFQLYEYINNHEWDVEGDAGLMEEMLKIVAQMNNESYYLSKIPNMPDVCVYSQLKGDVTPDQRENIEIEGVRLIHSKDPNKTVTTIEIDNGGADIMARENGSQSGMTLHIKDKTPLKPYEKDKIFQRLTIPCERGAKPEILSEGLHSFNMPSMDIGIIIHYKVGSDPTDYKLSTKLNIHYGTLLLDSKPIN